MKKGSWSFLVVSALCGVLLVAACGGNGNTDEPPSTSVTGGGTATGAGGTYPELPAIGGVIQKAHNQSYYDTNTCVLCHNGRMPVPKDPYWQSLYNKDGRYTVKAGSVQDHTDYKDGSCFNTNCHIKP
ncbi:MAG: hypothetical protein FWE97_02165 [Dehalococcoidia bacterium]|nr:hypothetical protein [Dehalococcoidia bacterium]